MVKNKMEGVLTDKQYEVFDCYVNHPFKMMILVGAVRAGKTYIDNIIFINELKRVQKLAKQRHDAHPIYILAGATSGSIRNNVISELERQFPELGVLKPDKNGHFHLFGVDIVFIASLTKSKTGAQLRTVVLSVTATPTFQRIGSRLIT